jgi:tetratricopeptide (TPR) repeat protein
MTLAQVPQTFPREAYLRLLQEAQHVFQTKENRRELLQGTGLSEAAAAPQKRSSAESDPHLSLADDTGSESLEDAEGPRFATALVEMLSEPGRLETAIRLARRIAADVGPKYDARDLLQTLEELYLLHRKQVLESGASPHIDSYREWVGFEVVHEYSLGDRFFGRQEHLEALDRWLGSEGAAAPVECLCALGGSGKSALAWHWLSRALPRLQERGYRGAFWCSFYEKDFDFESFLKGALAFGGRMDKAAVEKMPRNKVESQLLKVLRDDPFVIVADGLERLMNGYAVFFDRAVDPDSIRGSKSEQEVTPHDRRMTDPRNGAFLRALAGELASRVLITSRLGPAELEDAATGRPISSVHFTYLGGLAAEEVEALWKSILPQSPMTDELRLIFTLSGNHPLVVSILARSVARAGGDWNTWRNMEANRGFAPRRGASEAETRSQIIGTCMRSLDDRSCDVLGVLTTSGKPMNAELLTAVLQQGSAATGDGRWTSQQQVNAELDRLISLGFVGVAEPGGVKEYDVHPVVRGAVWGIITDPRRERFLSHALSEFYPTPDRTDTAIDLNRPTALFQLLVQSGETDRAWEMYLNKLWWPLTFRNDTRTLLSLLSLLLPDGDPLQLIPLRSRREQGSATEMLASLLMSAGIGDRSDKLFRWCGAIRLQTGDFAGFLHARHSRCWQTMYEGRLFETELELRAMREDAMHFGATDIQPEIECWIGVTLAMRGCEAEARRLFLGTQGKTASYRWWAQALAEGYVYLNEPDQALQWLDQAKKTQLTPTEGKLQEAWERLSRGLALFQKGENDDAMDDLSAALEVSIRANYAIIQCFAIPYMAEILLARDRIDEAETQIHDYFRIDPDSQYQLAASDAWRVRALCTLQRGDRAAAAEYAAKAYRLAACDGPPFVYVQGLRRAVKALEKCGAYVPRAESRLDPYWKRMLAQFSEDGREPTGEGDLIIENGNGASVHAETREGLFDQYEQFALIREASEDDRQWWSAITEDIPLAIQRPLAHAMKQSDITLESFRSAWESSPYKSVLVVFHQLQAESIVRPALPQPFGGLQNGAKEAWLANTEEHDKALSYFLSTDFAQRVASAFRIHALDQDTAGIRAFLTDNKRRIDYGGATAETRTWWDQLERFRPSMDMLILSESIYLSGTTLESFTREIATGTEKGIAYAFAAIGAKRAIEELEVRSISRTEGWSDVQILLRLRDVKEKLGWQAATPPARDFWASLEKDNSHQVGRVLQIAEELAIRRATIDDYYQAYLFSNTDDVQANLCYIDYSQKRNQVWDGQPSSWKRIGPAAASDTTASFSDTTNWDADRVRNRLQALLARLRFDEAREAAKAWWTSLEATYQPATLLRLVEELDSRGATMDELFAAKTDGSTENLPAAVAYLVFTRVKRGVVQRANDLNSTGNTHYENKRYREAIASYEGAIRIRPDSDVFYTNLAGAWEQLEDTDGLEALTKSIEVLEKGLKSCPQSDGIHRSLKEARTRRHLMEKGLFSRAPSEMMLPAVTPIAVEVGSDLIPLVEGMLADIPAIRERIRTSMGVVVPGVRFRGNETDMPATSYLIMLDEVPLVMGTVEPNLRFTTADPELLRSLGISRQSAIDPMDRSDRSFISVTDADKLGQPTLNASEYIERHIEKVILSNLSDFIAHDSVATRLQEEWGGHSREIAEDPILLGRFVRALRALVQESVPTIPLGPICAAFLEKARAGSGFDQTLEGLRLLPELRPAIPGARDGRLLELDDALEQEIAAGLHPHGDESVLALRPEPTQDILSGVRSEVGSLNRPATLRVRNGATRRYVRRLVELEFPGLRVLSTAELEDDRRPVEAVIESVR